MFKEFTVSEVFGNALLGKYHNPVNLISDANGYPYICASNLNNGINKDMPRVNGQNIVLTPEKIIAWGKQCPMFCYHDEPCVTSQGMYYLDMSAFDEKIALYVCGALSKACGNKYNYTNCLIGKLMDRELISLPVIENPNPDHEYTVDDIDWQYMRDRITELERDRITELEQERITELDAYLQATGLNDYGLTEDDKKILSLSAKRTSDEDGTLKDDSEDEVRFGEFLLKDIFGVEPIRGTRLTKENRVSGKIPLVTAGEQNEGIADYISNEENQTLKNMLTIDMFGNCFYRDYEYKSDDNILSFGLNKSRYVMLYFASAINNSISGRYNYGQQFRKGSYLKESIKLPIKSDGTPDFDYMERYIRAIEKVVIADVVKYKDKVIEETRKVVGA
jgi:hypothetical protein